MRLARVIGQVVATIKDPQMTGYRLYVVQPLNERLKNVSKPLVAIDGIQCAGLGDLVYMAEKRDAAIAVGDKLPVDATIMGYVDEVSIEENINKPKTKTKRRQKQ
jgi:ethanolamine utilization protein EutN